MRRVTANVTVLLRLAVSHRGLGVGIFAFVAICGPVDAVTQWFTATAKDRERPEEPVDSKDLLPVALAADVVKALVLFIFHFQVLDCRLVAQRQLNVEAEEHCHQYGDGPVHYESSLNDEISLHDVFVVGFLAVVIDV